MPWDGAHMSRDLLLEREWLVTNGLGGYASGTVSGAVTRRYHGLLIAALPAPLVIFVTGYDQHALAAFEADALAYLLKPVEPERLAQAVARACKLGAIAADRQRESEHILRVARAAPKLLHQIVCRKRDRLLLMPPEQILWFQVEDGIVKAHTAADTFWGSYK